MASIEDRIVRIQFDNAAFESRLASTLASLQKLNSTLATAGSRNGLTDLSHSVRNFSLGPVGAAIDGISSKFLALSTIGITVLSGLVTKAISAGAAISSALTLDPVTQGFKEYELQIGSIQTILANTSADGTNLADVSGALDELNTYADKTIYNFGQMTKNIGTFTAAGVDLDTSVQAIKGIANLGAISGSTPEQVASGMYQLSQAVSTGTLRLIDWNSVVNAGMGGEVFQKALFETGKVMGTLTDVPMGQTFEEWTAAGNSFRTSLDEGWLTADVLTTTLSGFTGEMTEAQLMAIGYSQEQAAEVMRLGQLGVDSATKVRTLTGLLQTSKEAMQSGWAKSFQLIFGNFEEATALFTRVSGAIGGIIQRSADARNELLQGWRDLGGREELINGFLEAFRRAGELLAPIKEAFRDIFPAMTAQRLFDITRSFNLFFYNLKPAPETIDNIKRIFTGLFGALEIGWTVLKEGVGFIKDLITNLTGLGSGNFLSFFAKIGDFFTDLNEKLVTGGVIESFFYKLGQGLDGPIVKIKELASAFLGLFDNIDFPDLSGIFDTIKDAVDGLFDSFKDLANGNLDFGSFGDIWGGLRDALGEVADILDEAWETISEWFGELGGKMADAIAPDDFDGAVDAINTGFLGAITAMLYGFMRNGINLDFGGGLLGNLSGAFSELNGVLSAMQTQLKADALMKIAIAIGILAGAVALLSTIDVEDMNNALGAIAIGFGQLIGAFALLNKLALSPISAATMIAVATGLGILSGAILALSLAVKFFSMMEWNDLIKGLVGVGASLGLLVGAALLLQFASGGMISMGIGLMAVAASLIIMAGAVKLFSMMDWDEMIKGLVGVGGALAAVAVGMALMPKSLVFQGAGLILIGTALNIIAIAVKQFSDFEWEDMSRGLAGVAGALVAISAGTYFLGPTLPIIAAGLIGVAISLQIISGVIKDLSDLSWEDLAKGLAGMAGALLAVGLAMAAIGGNVLGGAGMIAMAYSLTILTDVLQELGGISWGTLLHGLVGIASAFAVLGLAALVLAPVVPALLGLGAAILLLGAGFALFGVGVAAVGKGLQILAESGKAGIDVLIAAMEAFAKQLPKFLGQVAEGAMEMLQTLLDGLPAIIEQLGIVLEQIFQTIVDILPEAKTAFIELGHALLEAIRELFPDLVTTGFELLMALLTGIRDNIGQIVITVTEIITEFLDALSLQIPAVVDSVYNFLVAVFTAVGAKFAEIGALIAPRAMEIIQGLLRGLDENKGAIGEWFASLPGIIIGFLADAGSWLLEKGGEIINGLWQGAQTWWDTTALPWFQDLPQLIRTGIGGLRDLLLDIGQNAINGLKNGAVLAWGIAVAWIKTIPQKIRTAIGGLRELLVDIGQNAINGLKRGAQTAWDVLRSWLVKIPQMIRTAIGGLRDLLVDIGQNAINGLKRGAQTAWNILRSWLSTIGQLIRTAIGGLRTLLNDIGSNAISSLQRGAINAWEIVRDWFGRIPQSIRSAIGGLRGLLSDIGANAINSIKSGAQAAWDNVRAWFSDRAADLRGLWEGILSIGSPSKVFMWIGEMTMAGLRIGLEDEWDKVSRWLSQLNPADSMDENINNKMSAILSGISDRLGEMDELNPTITPVLDLTLVRAGAAELAGMLPANASYLQASNIARTALRPDETTPGGVAGSRDVTFEQNIYAPKQLSTVDIYRQTRNQIAMAKEELNIP